MTLRLENDELKSNLDECGGCTESERGLRKSVCGFLQRQNSLNSDKYTRCRAQLHQQQSARHLPFL